jgi:hypothetical protein
MASGGAQAAIKSALSKAGLWHLHDGREKTFSLPLDRNIYGLLRVNDATGFEPREINQGIPSNVRQLSEGQLAVVSIMRLLQASGQLPRRVFVEVVPRTGGEKPLKYALHETESLNCRNITRFPLAIVIHY